MFISYSASPPQAPSYTHPVALLLIPLPSSLPVALPILISRETGPILYISTVLFVLLLCPASFRIFSTTVPRSHSSLPPLPPSAQRCTHRIGYCDSCAFSLLRLPLLPRWTAIVLSPFPSYGRRLSFVSIVPLVCGFWLVALYICIQWLSAARPWCRPPFHPSILCDDDKQSA